MIFLRCFLWAKIKFILTYFHDFFYCLIELVTGYSSEVCIRSSIQKTEAKFGCNDLWLCEIPVSVLFYQIVRQLVAEKVVTNICVEQRDRQSDCNEAYMLKLWYYNLLNSSNVLIISQTIYKLMWVIILTIQ